MNIDTTSNEWLGLSADFNLADQIQGGAAFLANADVDILAMESDSDVIYKTLKVRNILLKY